MQYDPKATLKEFNQLMTRVRQSVPEQYEAFMNEKKVMTANGRIPEKTKWLLILVASVTEKCPICISRAVQHCLEAGWSKEEMLEACMTGVLVGGSSVMTYVTLVEKAIEELSGT